MSTIFLFYLIATLVQLTFWWVVVFRFLRSKKKVKNALYHSVSVIVASRNEEKKLPSLIQNLRKQNVGGDFEVIIVNDRSTDNSSEILFDFCNHFKELKVLEVNQKPNDWDGKKYALTQGVQKAKGDIVIFTDADCVPTSNNWVEEMVSAFNKKTEIVIGVGQYAKYATFLNSFIQYETLLTATQYLSLTLWNVHYMAVGRNVAYKRESFLSTGFGELKGHVGGDDDLMINRLANKENAEIVWWKNAQTLTEPKQTIAEYYHQKKRHLKSSTKYKLVNKIVLGCLALSQIVFWGSFVFLIVGNYSIDLILTLFILRIISLNLMLKGIAHKLNFSINPLIFILLDLIHTIYLFFFGAISWFSNNTQWK